MKLSVILPFAFATLAVAIPTDPHSPNPNQCRTRSGKWGKSYCCPGLLGGLVCLLLGSNCNDADKYCCEINQAGLINLATCGTLIDL